MTADARRGALAAVDRLVNRGGDADDLLRAVVELLVEQRDQVSWVGIAFVEDGELILGPSHGVAAGRSRHAFPISFRDRVVAELQVEGPAALDDEERAFLARVALLISPYCLVGWDTGGVPWSQLG